MSVELIGIFVTFISVIITGIISFQTFKLQKRQVNLSHQVDYLEKRIQLLQSIKNEWISYQSSTVGQKPTKENFATLLGNHADKTQQLISKSLKELKGNFESEEFSDIENKFEDLSDYLGHMRAKSLYPNVKPKVKSTLITQENLFDHILDIQTRLINLLNSELSAYHKRLEYLIEIKS